MTTLNFLPDPSPSPPLQSQPSSAAAGFFSLPRSPALVMEKHRLGAMLGSIGKASGVGVNVLSLRVPACRNASGTACRSSSGVVSGTQSGRRRVSRLFRVTIVTYSFKNTSWPLGVWRAKRMGMAACSTPSRCFLKASSACEKLFC